MNETPQNTEAERQLIGLTFINKRIPDKARELATTDFFSPNYRATWAAILETSEDGEDVEPFGVAERLKHAGHETSISELTNSTLGMIAVNESIFVEQIQDASRRRYLMRELSRTIDEVAKGKVSVSDLQTKLAEMETTVSIKGSFKSLADIIEKDAIPALNDLAKGITHRISTGFEVIDRIIGGGFSRSDVVVVAAQTGGGKSAFVLKLAVNIAKQNIPVAFVSGEMSDKENALRLISQASKFQNLNSATRIYDDELEYLTRWAEALKPLPIYFNSVTSDLQTLSNQLKNLVEKTGIQVLIIDYLQLFKTDKMSRQKRTERIAEVSQEVKRIAMRFGLAVIEVVQFNREGAKSIKSTMHDLEGSSQLEKDASLIFIIDREENSSEVELRIVKGRNVGKCGIKGSFKDMYLDFEF